MVATPGGSGSLIGATLGGYEVQALVGRGAMGSVYLARDTQLNRRVALKVLLGSLARSQSLVHQFHLEAQAAAPLRHQGIVRIYAAGIEEGTPYIAMEYVEGEPLDRFLQRKGRISWEVALQMGGQLAQALECAHNAGVIHRDIKPSNIMLDNQGRIRLTDFGIAQIQGPQKGASTGSNIIGTPQYMAPEQVTGGEAGPASDLFALGVTLYKMISGELPFRGESSMALVNSICGDDPPRLNAIDPSIPDDVARLVAYLIEKDPSARPANAKVTHGLIRRLQNQRGFQSSLSESLESFVKEQMEVQPFRGMHQDSSTKKKSDSTMRRKAISVKKRIAWRRVAQGAVIAVLSLAAMSIGPLMSTSARVADETRAPIIDMAAFQTTATGTKQAILVAEGFRFDRLDWVGSDPVLLARASGIRGTLAAGSTGLLSMNPVSEEIVNVIPPRGPVDDLRFSRDHTPARFGQRIPSTPEASLLHNTFLVHGIADGANPVVTLAQSHDNSLPSPHVLFKTSRAAWFGPSDPQWNEDIGSPVAVKPDGHTIAVLLYDTEFGYRYLVERDVRTRPLSAVGDRLTGPGVDIVPESVQYISDGSKLAYLQRRSNGDADLMVLTPGTSRLNGYKVSGNIVGKTFSFSPDGSHVAVVMQAQKPGQTEVVVLDVRLREVIARFGPGSISKSAWRPNGRYLVFAGHEIRNPFDTRTETDAPLQLYVGDIRAPLNIQQITRSGGGVEPTYAVSADGRWIAGVPADNRLPAVLFLEWGRLGLQEDV